MIKFKIILLITGIMLFWCHLSAQEAIPLSLGEAVKYALENNYDIINSQKDVEISEKQVSATMAIGFPQINANLDYTNFLELPTSLIPAEFFGGEPGEFIEVSFGTEHNFSAEATLTQLIFNGSYIVGLQAAKEVVDVSRKMMIKNETELKQTVENAYYVVLVTEETLTIIDSTLATLYKMQWEVSETFKQGFLEDTDVDQIDLLVSELEASRINVNKQVQITRNYLKFIIGMEIAQPVILTDNLESLIISLDEDALLTDQFDHTRNINYQLIQGRQHLKEFNLKNEKAQYLPSMVGFLSVSENAQRLEFNFFDVKKPWFRTSLFGVNLSIPILSSGQRKNSVQKARLELEQVHVMDRQVKEGLLLEFETSRSNYQNALAVYAQNIKNVSTADKIYRKTILKYSEGVSSSMDLLQSYNQYLNSQSSYISSMVALLGAKTALEKVLTKY